jgi:hypothetical protein
MAHDETPAAVQLAYLAKVLTGLALVTAVVLLALWLPQHAIEPASRQLAIAGLVLLALGLVPWVRWVYRRRDEMLQAQHQRACMHSLAWCAAASAAVGVLQAAEWLPLFSQFWTLGLLIAIWSLQLVWADFQNKP